MDCWQNGTAFAVGHRPLLYEYSGSNEHVYPRGMYGPARKHLETRFNGLPLVEFLATRFGSGSSAKRAHTALDAAHMPAGEAPPEDTFRNSLFSDFNYLVRRCGGVTAPLLRVD